MNVSIQYNANTYHIDLENPIDISMPLRNGSENVTAWYCSPPRIEPVMTEQFTGDVNLGGAVNFRNIYFNPHGHGTHTECVGHIAKEPYSIRQCLKAFNMLALLATITPELETNGDAVLTATQMAKILLELKGAKALILRTLPNDKEKLSRQYSNTNPPYITPDAMHLIVAAEIEHLLIDTPSVDREEDGGELLGHHIFWNYPENPRSHCTISELIFVPNEVPDALYWLQLGVAPFENDAAPSRPILYEILTVS